MKQVTLILVLLIISVVPLRGLCQTAEIDSLENLLLEYTQKDSLRVDLLIRTVRLLQNSHPDRTLKYIVEASEIAEELDYAKGKAETMDQMAAYYYVASNFSKVLEYSYKSLEINKAIANKKGMAKNFHDIAKIYYFQGDVDKAMNYLNKALDINIAIKDSASMCYNYASLGTNYSDMGDYDLALKYEEKAVEIAYIVKDENAISYAINNLGVIYDLQGKFPQALECYQKSFAIDERQKNYKDASISASNIALILMIKGNYVNALEFSKKGLQYAEQIGFKTGLTYNYENMSHVYKAQGNYEKAWENQERTLALQLEIGNQQGVVIGYRDIADLYVLQGKLAEALAYYTKALNLSKTIVYKRIEISSYIGLSTVNYLQQNYHKAQKYSKKAYTMAMHIGNLKLIKQSAEMLAKSYEGLGLFTEAYKAHVTFKTMSDSLYNEENLKKISNLEYEYKLAKEKEVLELEQQKKDKIQMAELNKQKVVIKAFVAAFFLMILLAIVIFRSSIQKRKANLLLQLKNKEIESTSEELRATNEELLTLSQFKEDMTNMVIHDLKNPLSAILNVDILPEGNKRVEIIKQSGLKMMNLVQNILDVYKYESTQIELSKEKIDILRILNNATEEMDFLAKLKNLEFKIDNCHGIEINADVVVLRRILVNILSNAVKFSPSNGIISIYCKMLEDDIVKIAIQNSGPHIPIENQEFIFKKFGQAEKKGQGQLNSTGLGLTYCKLATDAHGGAIGVESGETEGTIFWFTLPNAKIST